MRTLKEYEDQMREFYFPIKPKGLDILCPVENCGGELCDISNGTVLCSNPPRKAAKCNKCGEIRNIIC